MCRALVRCIPRSCELSMMVARPILITARTKAVVPDGRSPRARGIPRPVLVSGLCFRKTLHPGTMCQRDEEYPLLPKAKYRPVPQGARRARSQLRVTAGAHAVCYVPDVRYCLPVSSGCCVVSDCSLLHIATMQPLQDHFTS